MIQREKDKSNFFYYLNWRNLSDEIKSYGYVLTLPKALLYFGGFVVALGLVAMLFRLRLPFFIFTAIICLMFYPGIILRTYKKMYNERRFSDATMYMQQMMDSFRNFKKISKALNDTIAVFPEGPMRETLERAMDVLLNDTSSNSEKKALHMIEQEYPCKKIQLMHTFLERAENIGGDFLDGLDILQKDRSFWVERVKDYQGLKKNTKKYVVFAIIAGAGLILGVEAYIAPILPIYDTLLSQLTTVALVLSDLFLYVRADKGLTVDWLSDIKNDAEIKKEYDYVVNFDLQKTIYKAAVQMIIPAILVVLGIVLDLKDLFWGLLLVPYFIGLPHLTYQRTLKDLKKEISVQFPSWLLQIGLELQNKTVQTAIRSSLDYAPVVLQPELQKMVSELEKNPTSAEPYLNFLKDFYDPDIQQSMRSLYSISAGSGGNIKERIREVVNINLDHLNKMEKKISADKVAAVEFALIITSSLPLAGKIGVDAIAATMLYLADGALKF